MTFGSNSAGSTAPLSAAADSGETDAPTLLEVVAAERDTYPAAIDRPVPATELAYVQGIVSGQRAYLITNLLNHTSQTLCQPQMVWSIGRNRQTALPLPDRALSRRHAVILYAPRGRFQLIDLNSMNGAYVNGRRIQQRTWLHDGDWIRLGSTDFRFFVSQSSRSIEAVHPEVLVRLSSPKAHAGQFIDYSAEEPEIWFNLSDRGC